MSWNSIMYNIIFICYSSGKRLDILAVANAGCAWAFLLRRRRRLLWLPLPEVHLDPVASQENARVNQANQPLTLSLLVVHLLDVHFPAYRWCQKAHFQFFLCKLQAWILLTHWPLRMAMEHL